MSLVRLNRGLIRVSGIGACQFLQGLVTQDVVGGKAAGHESMASLFLNPKGRVISDAILIFPKNQDHTVLIDVPDGSVDGISNMLTRHKLRLPLNIDKMEDVIVCADSTVINDPRSSELPGRRVVEKSSENVNASVDAFSQYRRRRLLAGIPEGPEEIPRDSVVPIFYNFDLFNCISFTKGCYTGQELVTRTLRRGVVRKRLFPIKSGSSEVKVGDYVFYADEKIGEVIASEQDVGLAQLSIPCDALNEKSQIQDALKKLDMTKFSLRNDKNQSSSIELVVPQYMR